MTMNIDVLLCAYVFGPDKVFLVLYSSILESIEFGFEMGLNLIEFARRPLLLNVESQRSIVARLIESIEKKRVHE